MKNDLLVFYGNLDLLHTQESLLFQFEYDVFVTLFINKYYTQLDIAKLNNQ